MFISMIYKDYWTLEYYFILYFYLYDLYQSEKLQEDKPMYLCEGLHLSIVEGKSEWPNLKAAVTKSADIVASIFGS